MKVFSKKTNRYLTMSETLDTPEIQDTLNGHLKSTFDQLDLEIILCSQEEILALAIEMNERIDGTYVVSEEERKLRNKAEMIIMEKNGQLSGYNTFAGHFLLHNQELIN